MYATKYTGNNNYHETNRNEDNILLAWIKANLDDVYNIQKISDLEHQGKISVTMSTHLPAYLPYSSDNTKILDSICNMIKVGSPDQLFVGENSKQLQILFNQLKTSGKVGDVFYFVIATREINLVSYAYLSAKLKEVPKYLIFKEKKIDMDLQIYRFYVSHYRLENNTN